MALKEAPVQIHERTEYADQIEKAGRLIAERDPEDVDVAALALKLNVPVWSNDNDFEAFPQGRYTTAQLLRALEQ